MRGHGERRREPKAVAQRQRLKRRADDTVPRRLIEVQNESGNSGKSIGLTNHGVEIVIEARRHVVVGGQIEKQLPHPLPTIVIRRPRLDSTVAKSPEIFSLWGDRLDVRIEAAGLPQNGVADGILAVDETQPDHFTPLSRAAGAKGPVRRHPESLTGGGIVRLSIASRKSVRGTPAPLEAGQSDMSTCAEALREIVPRLRERYDLIEADASGVPLRRS
jgi:hypothetical protein